MAMPHPNPTHPAGTADFWHERWTSQQIGFHRDSPNPLLVDHWRLPPGRVLVPLCGASVDLGWLASRGNEVVGVELSPLACEKFFRDAGIEPRREGNRLSGGGVTLVHGDFFQFGGGERFDAFYDRAAMIALPASLRGRYVRHVKSLLRRPYRGLLVTMTYDQPRRDGPPFSVGAPEVRAAWRTARRQHHLALDDARFNEIGGATESAWVVGEAAGG